MTPAKKIDYYPLAYKNGYVIGREYGKDEGYALGIKEGIKRERARVRKAKK